MAVTTTMVFNPVTATKKLLFNQNFDPTEITLTPHKSNLGEEQVLGRTVLERGTISEKKNIKKKTY